MVDMAAYRARQARLTTALNDLIDTEVQASGDDETDVINAVASALGGIAFDRTQDDDFMADLGLTIVGN